MTLQLTFLFKQTTTFNITRSIWRSGKVNKTQVSGKLQKISNRTRKDRQIIIEMISINDRALTIQDNRKSQKHSSMRTEQRDNDLFSSVLIHKLIRKDKSKTRCKWKWFLIWDRSWNKKVNKYSDWNRWWGDTIKIRRGIQLQAVRKHCPLWIS